MSSVLFGWKLNPYGLGKKKRLKMEGVCPSCSSLLCQHGMRVWYTSIRCKKCPHVAPAAPAVPATKSNASISEAPGDICEHDVLEVSCRTCERARVATATCPHGKTVSCKNCPGRSGQEDDTKVVSFSESPKETEKKFILIANLRTRFLDKLDAQKRDFDTVVEAIRCSPVADAYTIPLTIDKNVLDVAETQLRVAYAGGNVRLMVPK